MEILQFENYTITGNTLFERPYDPEYDFKADPKILINANIYEAIRFPFFKLNDVGITYHSDSVINPLLLDTFGDYFNFWAYNDESGFVVNKTSIKPFWFVTHYSQMFSIVLTSVFSSNGLPIIFKQLFIEF